MQGGGGKSLHRGEGLWGRTSDNNHGYPSTETCCYTVVNLHSNPEKGRLSSPGFRQGNQASESLSVLAEVTQQGSNSNLGLCDSPP